MEQRPRNELREQRWKMMGKWWMGDKSRMNEKGRNRGDWMIHEWENGDIENV